MAIIAEWGPKTWEVSAEKVLALQGLSFSFAQVADNNSSTEEKKPTNQRGTELFPLSFSTVLHSGTGVDVRAEIDSWKALVSQVYYFFLGGEKLGPMLQLRKVDVADITLDDLGRMRKATLSFELKEYDASTTSVKVSASALAIAASMESKAQKKAENIAVEKAPTVAITVGAYVKVTGTKYATGQTIPAWVKEYTHKVTAIKESQNQVLLGGDGGINSWVFLNEVTLSPGTPSPTKSSQGSRALGAVGSIMAGVGAAAAKGGKK